MSLTPEKTSFDFIKWISLTIVLLFVTVYVILYQTEKRNQIASMKRLGRQATDHTAKMLESWISEQIRLVKMISQDYRVINACNNPRNRQAVREAQAYLQKIHQQYPFYENLPIAIKLPENDSLTVMVDGQPRIIHDGQFILDTVGGKTIGKCGPNYSYIGEIYKGKDFFISEVYASILRGNPIFVISKAVRNADGELIGVAIVSPQMSYFSDKFVETIKVGQTGYMFFMDQRPVLISHPNQSLILKSNAIEKLRAVYTEVITGGEEFESVFDGQKKLYIARKIQIPEKKILYDWYLIFTQTYAEITAPSLLFLEYSIGLGLVFIILYIFGMVLMYRIVTRRTGELVTTNEMLQMEVEQRQQTQDELARAKDVAEAANRAKSDFLANMSHEIRTPMNGVLGMTELVLMSNLDAKQREYLEYIQTSATNLLSIINDILDFSKIEAGKLELEKIPFDLKKLVNDTLKLLQVKADEKKISLVSEFGPNISQYYLGDPVRLKQILINLLNNGIKFTEKGSVLLKIRKASPDLSALIDSNGQKLTRLIIEIQDTGVGIPAEKQNRLFKAFSQADTSTTRKYGGTGLGLVISANLVKMMDGELSFESVCGQGTTFKFNPVLELTTRKKYEEFTNHQQTNLENDRHGERVKFSKGFRVLLVEDNLINIKVTMDMLQRLGLAAEIARNGIIAIEKFKSENFNLILMDCQMPEMDGYRAASKIRELEFKSSPTAHIPIIALTAHAMKGDREKVLAAGMDDYLTKPIDLDVLRRMLQKYLF